MRNPPQKDVFIVHSKRSPQERGVSELIRGFLEHAEYSVYGYDDWDWDRVERSEAYSWESGDEFDVEAQFYNEDGPWRSVSHLSKINDEPLRRMLSFARLVIIILPFSAASSGVLHEIPLLFGMRTKRRISAGRVRSLIVNPLSMQERRIFFGLLTGADRRQQILVCPWERHGKISGDVNIARLSSFDGALQDDRSAMTRAVEAALAASVLLLRTHVARSSADDAGTPAEIDRVCAVQQHARQLARSGVVGRVTIMSRSELMRVVKRAATKKVKSSERPRWWRFWKG
jgi:hypothetical protein